NHNQPPLRFQVFAVADILAHHQRIIAAIPTGNKLSEGEQESAGYEYAGKNFPNRTFIGFYSAGKKQQAIKQEHHAGQYSRLRALIAPDQAYIIFEKSTQTAKAIEPGIMFRTTSFNHIC